MGFNLCLLFAGANSPKTQEASESQMCSHYLRNAQKCRRTLTFNSLLTIAGSTNGVNSLFII